MYQYMLAPETMSSSWLPYTPITASRAQLTVRRRCSVTPWNSKIAKPCGGSPKAR